MIGENHKKIYDWLVQTWIPYGNNVCILEGFPGVGKTFLSQKVAQAFDGTSVFITATEASKESMEEVIFDLAFELDLQGNKKLADAIDKGENFRNTLIRILQEPILIIIDEFQEILGSDEEVLPRDWRLFLRGLTSRPSTKGKLLILTNRTVKHTKWAEPIDIKIVKGLNVEDGEQYLNDLLRESDRENEISSDQKEGIIRLLGGNPRAMKLLISSLRFTSLEDLIKVTEESWEYKGRYFSPALVEKLEIRLLKNILNHISEADELILRQISVLRKPFKRQVFALFLKERHLQNQFKKRIIELFLVEQYKGWFKLNPIVREVELNKLYESHSSLIDAHKSISRYYTRHFHEKDVVGRIGNLGAFFNEARFHLSFLGNDEELENITYLFANYITKTLSEASSIPKTPQALNERIAVLSSFLQEPGPRGLEYHLARLYSIRDKNDDLENSVIHGKRSLGLKDPHRWLFLAKQLTKLGRNEEAVEILKDGIIKLPIEGDLRILYQASAEILNELDRNDEAILLLEDGLKTIPSDKGLREIYRSYSELLGKLGRDIEAINLLKTGFKEISVDQNVRELYEICAKFLSKINRDEEAIELLKESIAMTPVEQNIIQLYHPVVELLVKVDRAEEAIELLKDGIANIPRNQNIFPLYQLFIESLLKQDKYDEVLEFIRLKKNNSDRFTKIIERCIYKFYERKEAKKLILFKEIIQFTHTSQYYLIEVFINFIEQKWEQSLATIQTCKTTNPAYKAIIIQEAFAWLSMGNAKKSVEALQSLARRKNEHEKTSHVLWLRACAHLMLNEKTEANRYFSLLKGNQVELEEEALHLELFKIWNNKQSASSKGSIYYQFPIQLPMFSSLSDRPSEVGNTPSSHE